MNPKYTEESSVSDFLLLCEASFFSLFFFPSFVCLLNEQLEQEDCNCIRVHIHNAERRLYKIKWTLYELRIILTYKELTTCFLLILPAI